MTKMQTGNYNENGFALVSFFIFLILFSILIFSYAFINYIYTSKSAFKKLCFIDAVQTQKDLLKAEKNLFSLNPISTALRTEIKLLKIQLASAIASQNYALAAEIEIKLSASQQKQIALDTEQKALIQLAEINLQNQMRQIISSAITQSKKINSAWMNYLSIFEITQIKHLPSLAIQPDSEGGTAPNYEFQNNYHDNQSLALVWHNSFSNILAGQQALIINQKFALLCEVKPNKGNKLWEIEVNLDKF